MQNFNLFLNKLKHQKGKRFRSLVFAWLHRGYATRDKVLRRRFKRERREKERCHKQTNKQTKIRTSGTVAKDSTSRTNLLSRQLRAFHTRFTSNRRRETSSAESVPSKSNKFLTNRGGKFGRTKPMRPKHSNIFAYCAKLCGPNLIPPL